LRSFLLEQLVEGLDTDLFPKKSTIFREPCSLDRFAVNESPANRRRIGGDAQKRVWMKIVFT